jgi:hypothetical protein
MIEFLHNHFAFHVFQRKALEAALFLVGKRLKVTSASSCQGLPSLGEKVRQVACCDELVVVTDMPGQESLHQVEAATMNVKEIFALLFSGVCAVFPSLNFCLPLSQLCVEVSGQCFSSQRRAR